MAIRAVLFDLDNTIYPASNGLMHSIDRRIGEYVQQALGIDEDEALRLRRQYYAEFGTTLRGLQQHHSHIETESYLQYVHDVALEAFLASDQRLDELLAALPARKIIFTNSPAEYAVRVLDTLGITEHFERIFDVRCFNFIGKPDPACYQTVLQELGIDGHEAMFIEDTAINLEPAASLGMTTVLIADRAEALGVADYVVPDVLAAIELAGRLVASESSSRDGRVKAERRGRKRPLVRAAATSRP